MTERYPYTFFLHIKYHKIIYEMAFLESISNVTLCDWFYIMFIANSIVGVIMLIRIVIMLMYTRPGILLGSGLFFITLLAVIVPVINGAFFYALCDRALIGTPISVPQPIKSGERNLVFGTF